MEDEKDPNGMYWAQDDDGPGDCYYTHCGHDGTTICDDCDNVCCRFHFERVGDKVLCSACFDKIPDTEEVVA